MYDADCSFCTRVVDRLAAIFKRYGFETTPLQTAWVKEALGYSDPADASELLKEMRVLTVDRQVFGGAKAIVYLAGCIWWAFPLRLMAFIPGFMWVLDRGYRWIAARRYCSATGCAINKRNQRG